MSSFKDIINQSIKLEKTTQIKRDTTSYPPKPVYKTEIINLKGFMDTPNTTEELEYSKLGVVVTRVLFTETPTPRIESKDVIIYQGRRYDVVGEMEDQGGQGLYFRTPLRAQDA